MPIKPGEEVQLLVATDVMSEGLNLQDGDVVVNYDLHWNPVRLIQRFGRIDRIGAENDTIWGFNFLPERSLERQLGLQEVLARRIREIHETIGEDAAILDRSETLNEEAMFSIYRGRTDQLALFEEEDLDAVDLNEAEEMLRTMRAEDPAEFARIAGLRDGIRSARAAPDNRSGRYVLCRAGGFLQLFLANQRGEIVSRDLSTALGRIGCSADEPAARIPGDHNLVLGKVLQVFAREAQQRRAQQRHGLSLSVGQRYVLRELRAFRGCAAGQGDADLQHQIDLLERAFRRPLPTATRRLVNVLRRNGVVGTPLLRALAEIYHEHGLADREEMQAGDAAEERETDAPRIVCSEALV
jgi:hypothetical protein